MATPPETIWRPASIFLPTPKAQVTPSPGFTQDFALLILNQPLELPLRVYRQVWSKAAYRIAADGGANRVFEKDHPAQAHGGGHLPLDTIIGDLDSLAPQVHAHFRQSAAAATTEILRDGDQESTDFQKAVRYLRTWGVREDVEYLPSSCEVQRRRLEGVKAAAREAPMDIVCLGGLGGRVDQALSQIHQLYSLQDATYSTGRIYLLSTEAVSFILKGGRHRIKVRDAAYEEEGTRISLGAHIGIIPMREPSVISTQGLFWDVQDWPTSFGGQMSTSNHVKDEWVSVETQKDILFTIHLTTTNHPCPA